MYSHGFAAQKTLIGIVAEKDGTAESFTFQGAGELRDWEKEHEGWVIKARHDELTVEPLEYCLSSIKNTLKILAQRGTLAIYLSGTGNFRERIAKFIDYKGNRDRLKRPVHYDAIRGYLVDYHGAYVVDGREADDELSIVARRYPGRIIATCDKDLDQVPGKHYNYRDQIEYDVSDDDARRWFWIQVLAGDPTDNVPGCYRVGPKKAAALIDSFWGYPEIGIWDRVVAEYHLSQGRIGCPYVGHDSEAVALETARMVYIQQKPGELWNPPGTPFGRIAGNVDD